MVRPPPQIRRTGKIHKTRVLKCSVFFYRCSHVCSRKWNQVRTIEMKNMTVCSGKMNRDHNLSEMNENLKSPPAWK